MPPFPAGTERLTLREWRDEDREPFAEMNADAAVMEFFPAVLTRQESDSLVDRIIAGQRAYGFCPWAVELRETGAFLGFVGLTNVPPDLPFAPATEIGWRLRRAYWGRGYATEAGRRVLDYAFDQLGLAEIVSFTSERNVRSRSVMERLGMTHAAADDFSHPRIPAGHALCSHVLYRVRR